MKRLMMLCFVSFGFIDAAQRLDIQCEVGYRKKICGDDYSCEASKCWINNTDILTAFRNDLRFWIESAQRRERANEPQTQLYQKALLQDLPNIQTTKRVEIKNKYGQTCFMDIKRPNQNTLEIRYNDCSDESDFKKTYQQNGQKVEIIEDGDNGA